MAAIHTEPHPLAGKRVRLGIKGGHPHIADSDNAVFRVEDWWDRAAGQSWMDANGNPACLVYAMRGGINRLPIDDEVVYGHVGGFGHLIHVSELGAEVEQQAA